MSIGETWLPEFDQEMTTTRKVIARVPGDKGQWKPHPKSFALGHLAQLVASGLAAADSCTRNRACCAPCCSAARSRYTTWPTC